MKDKVVVVTGATGGIGAAAVKAFAEAGAKVVLVSRSKEKLDRLAAKVRAEVPGADLEIETVDLSDVVAVKQAAAAIGARHPAIHALVNNAGTYKATRAEKRGLEEMFATNHLAPFALTTGLEQQLRAGKARVINVSAPSTSAVVLDDLQATRKYSGFGQFGSTKAMNLYFTAELARRWRGSGVTTAAMHPGFVKSEILREAPAPMRFLLGLVSAAPEKAGKAIVSLASEPGVDGAGRFFKLTSPLDLEKFTKAPIAGPLWEASEKLVASA